MQLCDDVALPPASSLILAVAANRRRQRGVGSGQRIQSSFPTLMPALQPCLLERKILPKPWGGRALSTVLGIELPADIAVGETWELYDRPDGSSRIRGSDATLQQLMQRDARGLLGRARPGRGGCFPLLLKYLDAREALSVQVHPDDEGARPERDGGKSEAWVVLGAGPAARIIRGVKPGVSKPQLAEVARTGASGIAELLLSFAPSVGDCIYVPAGTVHAIGPDVVVFEVQQNSDVTYRLYDWGRQREVHVDKALAVAHLDAGGSDRSVVTPRPLAQGELLVSTPHFRLRRLHVVEQRAVVATEGAFLVINVVGGRGMLGWHSGGSDAPLFMQTGDCALVPACVEQVFLSPIGRLQVLLTDPGEVR